MKKYYYATLIKDRFPRKVGQNVGPLDEQSYKNLLTEGFINDEENLVEKPKPKPKKETKKTEDN